MDLAVPSGHQGHYWSLLQAQASHQFERWRGSRYFLCYRPGLTRCGDGRSNRFVRGLWQRLRHLQSGDCKVIMHMSRSHNHSTISNRVDQTSSIGSLCTKAMQNLAKNVRRVSPQSSSTFVANQLYNNIHIINLITHHASWESSGENHGHQYHAFSWCQQPSCQDGG